MQRKQNNFGVKHENRKAEWIYNIVEELDMGGRMETIQTTELVRSARILRGVLET